MDLRGAQIHWANELSSKKNVFKVRNEWKKKLSERSQQFNKPFIFI